MKIRMEEKYIKRRLIASQLAMTTIVLLYTSIFLIGIMK